MNIDISKIYQRVLLFLMVMVLAASALRAQSVYQPYSYQFYQKFSTELYATNTAIHTSIKPWFVDDTLLRHKYDSLMQANNKANGLLKGRFFNEHLVDVQRAGYTLYADILPDLQTGYDFASSKATWLTTLGYQVGGTIGSKFSFYGSGYNNKAQLPAYITNYANSTGVVPGQTRVTNRGSNITDWSYYAFLLSYTPVKYVNFTAGQDKNFIGDGYRSMLLSDYASPYPFFKATVNVGSVKYIALYSLFEDPNGPKVPGDNSNLKKWGYFQYIDWSVSNRVSLGFFESLVSADRDSVGHKRGFDFSYASPLTFLTTVESSHGSPDKNGLGLTFKWKFADKNIVYGQFYLTEFQAGDFFSSNGSSRNKYAYQLGIRGADLLKVKTLNYLFEFNAAKPYTYTETVGFRNYSHYDEPLAHPLGANFREWLGILNYSTGRFDLQGQLNYAYYGMDMNGLNYGQNIFESYQTPAKTTGNFIGQGLRTDFYYAEGKIAYLLNPKYNLRLELGALYRDEKNSVFNNKTGMITFGLRSSFRNIYNDF
ncbi:gliding motility protein RemB [Mucilaginibacter sp. PPCGB 2223]|uniref:gliding motility protein RemB n=1 Tax=Mucilaginibacter sp. PPCGB 2223 TaxID=1886027 RepID=UPI0008269238|nr:gliding motility protein RemB [Mucilaginibacter sp. PPCGB 2223]OCX53969.1 gliding motility protein RemB [Mucilaginibacter sp. PPCGB 2223]